MNTRVKVAVRRAYGQIDNEGDIAAVSLVHSMSWSEKCCRTEPSSVPAGLPPSLTVSFDPSSRPYTITAALRNAAERVCYEVRTDLR